MKLLFVCLGNICRSPTAHGVMMTLLKEHGLDDVMVDSAGTAAYHIGKAPDPRTQAAARQRGYDLSTLRARQVTRDDFYDFDYIFAMDEDNLADLQGVRPKDAKADLHLALASTQGEGSSVPDPYFGGESGFDTVLDLCEKLSNDILVQYVKADLS